MKQLLQKRRPYLYLFVIFIIYFCFAFYKLAEIPAEWFGDISNLHGYVLDIQAGKWPVSYRQGVGPLYHYLITPFVNITSQQYVGYKILSVLSGGLSLLAFYLFVSELLHKRIAVLATVLYGTSFWFLVWARLGNLHAILPGVVCLCLWALCTYQKKHQIRFLILSTVAAWSGCFWYVGTIVLPVVFALILFSFIKNIPKRHLIVILFISIFLGLAFRGCILVDPNEFTSKGYIGEKVNGLFTTPGIALVRRFVLYSGKAAAAYVWKGDQTFRVNVPGSPHIDMFSALFLLIGLGSLLVSSKNRLWLGIPLVLFTLPSISPSLLPEQIPSMTRTFASSPFIFILIAIGFDWIYRQTDKKGKKWTFFCGGILVSIIVFLNINKYYVAYPKTLPNHNSPFGTIIARYIDTVPSITFVAFTSCCWGDWGQPEPKPVYYQLTKPQSRTNILYSQFIRSCWQVDRSHDTILLLRPEDTTISTLFTTCFPDASKKMIVDKQNQKVAEVLFIPGH
jgi:4-amino-4-deoxy-L-arabinose transferase-like glycosyltransferase